MQQSISESKISLWASDVIASTNFSLLINPVTSKASGPQLKKKKQFDLINCIQIITQKRNDKQTFFLSNEKKLKIIQILQGFFQWFLFKASPHYTSNKKKWIITHRGTINKARRPCTKLPRQPIDIHHRKDRDRITCDSHATDMWLLIGQVDTI